jgi:anti-sigma factor RsiW
MSTKENRSIAYIYNEMDPSEKLEFERDLNNDNDLLIEVESLKKISKDLNQLEQISPPAHVVDAVFNSAKINSQESSKPYWKPIFYSAAAILLVGITSGIFLLEDPTGQNDINQETESASVATGVQLFSEPANTSYPSEDRERLEPWVDNNEVFYFQGQTASDNSLVSDSIRNESLKKLTPVNPAGQQMGRRHLQLTGSRN